MPTTVTTKSSMKGTKRKGAPSKDAGMKDNKKLKIDSGKKAVLKNTIVKPKSTKKLEEQSDTDDFDSDGGTPLHGNKSEDLFDLEESDTTEFSSESKADPPAKDNVHLDRAKAAAANSKHFEQPNIYNTYNCKVNRQKSRMQSKSNWPKNERQPNHWPNHWRVQKKYGSDFVENRMYQLRRGKSWLQNCSKLSPARSETLY